MMDNTVDVMFTRDVYNSLISDGYTHIVSLGVDDCDRDDDVKDTYWLQALKNEDDRITSNDPDFLIHEITHHEVVDMIEGVDDITFMIKVPKDVLTAETQNK